MSNGICFRLVMASALVGVLMEPAVAEQLVEAPWPRAVTPAEVPMPRATLRRGFMVELASIGNNRVGLGIVGCGSCLQVTLAKIQSASAISHLPCSQHSFLRVVGHRTSELYCGGTVGGICRIHVQPTDSYQTSKSCLVRHGGVCSTLAGALGGCAGPCTLPAPTRLPLTPLKQMAADAFDQLLVQHGVITPPPCLTPLAATTPATNVAVAGAPTGTWTRELGSCRSSVTFAPDHLTITFSLIDNPNGKSEVVYVILTADYCMARDGVTVLGLITSIDARCEGDWHPSDIDDLMKRIAECRREVAEQPFAMKVRVYGGVLVIGDIRMPAELDYLPLTFIAGRYTKATDKPAPVGRLSLLHDYAADLNEWMGRISHPCAAIKVLARQWWACRAAISDIVAVGHRVPQDMALIPLLRELANMPEGGATGQIGLLLSVPLTPVPREPVVPAMPEPTSPVFPMPQPVRPSGY